MEMDLSFLGLNPCIHVYQYVVSRTDTCAVYFTSWGHSVGGVLYDVFVHQCYSTLVISDKESLFCILKTAD